ncbi:MAG: hypothetical protein ACK4TN_00285, partial [Brevinematales bacterium]
CFVVPSSFDPFISFTDEKSCLELPQIVIEAYNRFYNQDLSYFRLCFQRAHWRDVGLPGVFILSVEGLITLRFLVFLFSVRVI